MDICYRVALIAQRVLAYVAENMLPPPDFGYGCPTLEQTIESLLKHEQLTDDECYRFVTRMENVDPEIPEEEALAEMHTIICRARLRRGVAPDRFNDAVSF